MKDSAFPALGLARALLDAIPEACLLISPDTPLVANKAFFSISGYTPADFMRLCPGSLIAPEDR